VTHYFFDDCAYYTPMLSDPFRGRIEFRHLTDLTTMQPAPLSFSGERVPDAFLRGAVEGFAHVNTPRKRRSWKRKLRKLFEFT
jgi:hypothetical protein